VSRLTIHSALGGTCRVRLQHPLAATGSTGLKLAVGKNNNPFYRLPSIKEPLLSAKAPAPGLELAQKYEYDFTTEAGKTYVFTPK